eukprot:Em0001g1907a
MAAHYGRLTDFDRGVEEWVTYIERLEQYFAANEIADNGKKRAILLSACGAATYRLIRTLVSPSKPGEKSFTEIVKLVSDHHNPKPSAIMQRFKFNCRMRGSNESVAEYVTSLRQLAEHCEYGQFLDDILRDRIVCGINDAQTQRRLLGEAGLTLKGAFEIALAMESATKSCAELQSTSTQFLDTETQSISQPVPQPVHRLQGKPGTDKTGECFRCGGNHMATTCWARTELDTGASMTLISKKTLDKLWPRETRPKLRSTSTRLRTYTGESLEVLGIAVVDVVYRDQQAKLKLVVVKQDGPCLLGRDWLKAIKFDVSFIPAVTASVSNIQQLLNVHATLFEEKLGLFKAVVAKLLLNLIAHIMDDGSERPVGYASRSLSQAEKGYSQLDKEALAIVFGVTKFNSYLYGCPFTIYSDHKPLMYLFGEHKGIPTMASARVLRWAVTLSAYQYSIRYKPGSEVCHADALSRLPIPSSDTDCIPGSIIGLIDFMSSTPMSSELVKKHTQRDPVLSRVCQFVLKGWTEKKLGEPFFPYESRKYEFSVQDGVLLWGSRIVVPPRMRSCVLDELHETHQGIVKMKGLARGYVWWPGMDSDIEKLVKSCNTCQVIRHFPPTAPLHPWEWPKQPWSRLHADFAGPFQGHMFLLLVDACSKWLDVHVMKSISSSAIIEKLRSIFAIHGLPDKLVTDNGPAFISSEFKTFMDYNGIVHIRSAPYHPSTNGLAERAVQTLKDGLRCIKDGTIETRLARFLSKYRLTPHSTTGLSPSEMLLGRCPRSRLDLMNPDLTQKVLSNQLQQKCTHDNSKQARSFKVGEEVYVRSFNNINHWIPGSILATTGPLSYKISLANGVVIKRHVDHVKARYSRDQSFQVPASIPHSEIAVRSQDQTNLEPVNLPAEAIENAGDLDPELHHDSRVRAPEAPAEHSEEIEVPDATTLTEQPLRRSTRIRHPPIRYGTELCVNFEEGEM